MTNFIDPWDLTDQISPPTGLPVFSGPYSMVYTGKYNNNMVAIKVLKPVSQASLHTMRRKVRREKTVWSRMNHPNILPLLGYTQEDDRFGPFGALITPWCKNGDAGVFFETHGSKLEVDQRVTIFLGVVDGVRYLHGHNPVIVHGDIKPGNILLDEQLNPQICDFGLAYIFAEDGPSGMTTTSDHTGTDRYLAYELVTAEDTPQPSTASDVWALGCVGLQIIFLQIPYSHRKHNFNGKIYQDIRDRLLPANLSPSAETVDLWGILVDCWIHDPVSRVTAEMLSFQLSTYCESISDAASLEHHPQASGGNPPLNLQHESSIRNNHPSYGDYENNVDGPVSQLISINLPSMPAELEAIAPYVSRAKELKDINPIISYYCLYYAVQIGIEKRTPTTKPMRVYLMEAMTILENIKEQLKDRKEVNSHRAAATCIENFALQVFNAAADEDRRGGSNPLTAKKFLAAINFFEILVIFDKRYLNPNIQSDEKIKYSRSRAAAIAKAHLEGRRPQPEDEFEGQNSDLEEIISGLSAAKLASSSARESQADTGPVTNRKSTR